MTHGDDERRVSVERRGNELLVEHEGTQYIVRAAPSSAAGATHAAAGERARAGRSAAISPGEAADAPHAAGAARVYYGTEAARAPGFAEAAHGAVAAHTTNAARAPGPEGRVTAPMTGTIKEIMVAEGDRVAEGERLLVMEAMKMDLDVSAPVAGTVIRIDAQPGTTVRERDSLVIIG